MSGNIGIIGYGAIGSRLFERINADPALRVAFVYDVDQDKLSDLKPSLLLNSLKEARKREIDLVVEVVSVEWVKKYASTVLGFSDLLIVSVAAFAADGLRNELDAICRANKTRYYISHGAILGMDGIKDGREMIEAVKITTIRPQAGYGLKKKLSKRTVLYDGPTRKACELFPHNVNIHASLALHGLGFDKTHSTVIADPEATIMKHCIEVKGRGLEWKIEVQGKPIGARNSAYIPESVFQTVKRICTEKHGMTLI